MELRRRDALAALAAAGVAVGGAATLAGRGDEDDGAPAGETDTVDVTGEDDGEPPLSASDLATLTAVAEVVYPDAVEGVPAFVETYSRGRVSARPEYGAGVEDAIAEIEAAAEAWYDGSYTELDAETRESLLRELGCDTAEPDPGGTTAERVRYYVVNELLFALYSSPTGGELVGVENPQGHPGGTTSYRRGPDR